MTLVIFICLSQNSHLSLELFTCCLVPQLLWSATLGDNDRGYLVRWQGHTSAAYSWEPAEHLVHCPERVGLKKIGSVP